MIVRSHVRGRLLPPLLLVNGEGRQVRLCLDRPLTCRPSIHVHHSSAAIYLDSGQCARMMLLDNKYKSSDK